MNFTDSIADPVEIHLIDPDGTKTLWRTIDRSQIEFWQKKTEYLAMNDARYANCYFSCVDFRIIIPKSLASLQAEEYADELKRKVSVAGRSPESRRKKRVRERKRKR